VILIFCKCEHLKIYITIIVPVVLYGCETWSLTLREERRLRVFEIRVLRRVFRPKRDEVTGEWGKLHYGELNDLYSSPSIVWVTKSRRMRWVGHVVHIGERRGIYRVVGCWGTDWIELAQDRDGMWAFVYAVMNLQIP